MRPIECAQFAILQTHLSPALSEYIQMTVLFARECGVLLAAYEVGHECKPRLKQPEGWIAYLGRIIDVHFGGSRPDRVLAVENALLRTSAGRTQ